jgi:hypothetical protein
LDDEAQGFVAVIRRSAQRMSRLIDDLLAYSRLEQRPIAMRHVNLQNMIKSIAAERAADVDVRGITLRINVPDVAAQVEPEGLAQSLRNLLDNALKFTRHNLPRFDRDWGRAA